MCIREGYDKKGRKLTLKIARIGRRLCKVLRQIHDGNTDPYLTRRFYRLNRRYEKAQNEMSEYVHSKYYDDKKEQKNVW